MNCLFKLNPNLIPELLPNKYVLIFSFLSIFGNIFSQFSPPNISGLELWLLADSVVENNGLVDIWNDESGNNYNLTQNIVANRPVKINNVINGHATVQFDGIDDNLKTLFGQNYSDSITVFILMNNQSSNPVFVYDGGTDFLSMIYVSGGLYIQSSTPNIFYLKSAPFGYTLFQNQYFNSQSKIYENGAIKLTGTLPQANLNGFTVGSIFSQNVFFFQGNIAEIIVYNRILDSLQKNEVENYFRDKYAPPIDLGPDILAQTFCPIALNVSTEYTNVQWGNGSTLNTISVDSTQIIWVEGTDIFGNVSFDTILVSFPTIANPLTTNVCANSSITWNTNLSAPFTFLWSNGATTPSLNITTPGDYWVEVTDAAGCSKRSDTLTFFIDNYANTTSLGGDTTLCAGNPIGLQVGSAQTVSYLWQNGATTPTIPISSSGTYSVQATNNNGCVAFDTINVIVSGTAPNALFADVNGCKSSSFSFVDQSSGVGGDPIISWNWNFGNGQTSLLQNPTMSFANAGLFPVQLTIQSAGGCAALFSGNVRVFENPVASFQSVGACTGAVTGFFNSSIAGDTTFSAFSWNFGQPSLGVANTSTVANPSRTFPDPGSFPIVFSVTDFNGCSDDTVVIFQMNQTPAPSFTVDEVCTGQSMNFINTSVADVNSTLVWNFGDGTSSNLMNPSKTYLGFGVRSVLLEITSPSGCVQDFSQNVVIHPFPNPSMEIGARCVGTFTDFSNQSTINLGSIDSVWWVFNQTDTLFGDVVTYFIPSSNQQQVVLFTESDFGCQSSFSQFYSATQALNADFNLNSSIVATGAPINFQNTSVGGQFFNWNFGDGNTSQQSSPSHIFDPTLNGSSVNVRLIAETNSGCKDTISRVVNLQSSRLDLGIGNLFYQPNGNFAIIGVELVNNGTVTLTEVDLFLSSHKGAQFIEKWSGSLQPNEKIVYVFKSQPVYSITDQDLLQSFYCVEGSVLDQNGLDLDPTNNRFCKAIEGNQAILMTIFPNPVKNNFKINLLISEQSNISIDIMDVSGRIIQRVFEDVTFEKGLYEYDINTRFIESGNYFVRMMSNDDTRMQRIQVAK